MPKYKITDPQGRTFVITAPEGATREQIMAFVAKQAKPSAPKSAAPERPSMLSDNETVREADAVFRGAKSGVTMGFADELEGLLGASIARIVRPDLFEDQSFKDTYKEGRDAGRAANAALSEESPWLYHGTELAAGMAVPVGATAKGAKLGKSAILEGAKMGAGYGAVSGIGQSTGDLTEGDIETLAEDALASGLLGGAFGGALPIAGAAVTKTGRATGNFVDRIRSYLGNDEAAQRVFLRYLGDKLQKSGASADDIKAAVTKAESVLKGQTLSEATGNRAAYQAESNISKGADKAAQRFEENIYGRPGDASKPGRNKTLLRQKIEELKRGFDDAAPKYKTAEEDFTANEAILAARKAGERTDLPEAPAADNPYFVKPGERAPASPEYTPGVAEVLPETQAKLPAVERVAARGVTEKPLGDEIDGMIGEIEGKLSKMTNRESGDPEKQALIRTRNRLLDVKESGYDYDTLRSSKTMLQGLLKEHPDPAAQRLANQISGGYANRIEQLLTERAPTHAEGTALYKQGAAGRNLENAMRFAKEGDVNAVYQEVAGTPALREEFLNRLPEQVSAEYPAGMKQHFSDVFDALEGINRRGWGGAKPASIPSDAAEARNTMGLGINPNSMENFGITRFLPNALVDFAKGVSSNARNAGVDIVTNPGANLDDITGAVTRAEKLATTSDMATGPMKVRANASTVNTIGDVMTDDVPKKKKEPLRLNIPTRENMKRYEEAPEPVILLPQIGPQSNNQGQLGQIFARMLGGNSFG